MQLGVSELRSVSLFSDLNRNKQYDFGLELLAFGLIDLERVLDVYILVVDGYLGRLDDDKIVEWLIDQLFRLELDFLLVHLLT